MTSESICKTSKVEKIDILKRENDVSSTGHGLPVDPIRMVSLKQLALISHFYVFPIFTKETQI